jgi:hypothetical protein
MKMKYCAMTPKSHRLVVWQISNTDINDPIEVTPFAKTNDELANINISLLVSRTRK